MKNQESYTNKLIEKFNKTDKVLNKDYCRHLDTFNDNYITFGSDHVSNRLMLISYANELAKKHGYPKGKKDALIGLIATASCGLVALEIFSRHFGHFEIKYSFEKTI